MPSFPSLEPKVGCFDDLDFFKYFENEFPVIVYNDALTSISNYLTELTLSPQHIDEFDLKDETSLSEYYEVEQNVLYFNDLFPFNIIYPEEFLEASHNKKFSVESFIMELKINIVTWNYLVNGMLLNLIKNLYVSFGIPFDPKWYYKDGVYTRMLRRPRIIVFCNLCTDLVDFTYMALPPKDQKNQYLRYEGLQYTDADIADFETRLGTSLSYTLIKDPMLRLCHRIIACSTAGRSHAPEKVTVTDLFYLRGIDVGSVNVPYLLARDLGVYDIWRLQIYVELDDTYAWLALGPERQQVVVAGALEADEDAPVADEGASAIPVLVQAPQQPPPASGPARTMAQRLSRVEEDVHEIRGA
ncbi:hypothetical protein Tco_0643598, partial [Tanacetum coccineum]